MTLPNVMTHSNVKGITFELIRKLVGLSLNIKCSLNHLIYSCRCFSGPVVTLPRQAIGV